MILTTLSATWFNLTRVVSLEKKYIYNVLGHFFKIYEFMLFLFSSLIWEEKQFRLFFIIIIIK